MSSSVQVTSTAGAQMTWASSTFDWNSIDATSKTWDAANVMSFDVSIAETLTGTGALSNGVGKSISESFQTVDSKANAIDKNFAESVLASDLLTRALAKRVAEALSIVELETQSLGKNFAESIAASEVGLAKAIIQAVSESIAVSESWSDITQFHIKVSESFATREALGKIFTKELADDFTASEHVGKSFEKTVSESLQASDVFSRLAGFNRAFSESLSTADALPALAVHKALLEGWQTSDSLANAIVKQVVESIHAAEVYGRVVVFNRSIDEGAMVSEALAKAIALPKFEAVKVVEEYRRHGNAAISDLSILTTDMDASAFAAMISASSPPGYNTFRNFIPGNYEYERALVRVVLQSKTLDRGILKDVALTVDVPDVYDRGEANVTDGTAGLAVLFNRPFHDTPEVTLTLKGGTSTIAIPKFLVAPSKTGFTVTLTDTSGNPMTGLVSWAAHGY